MKKLLLLVCLSFAIVTAKAQNTFPTSGNVGIGTTTPTQRLEIGGGRPITFNTSPGAIKMKGDAGGWAMNYGFLGSNGTDQGGFWGFGSADGLNQWSIGKTHTDNFFVVRSNGNIGVGTNSPSHKLDIAGSSMRLNNTAGSAYLYVSGSGTTAYAGSYIFLNAGTTTLGDSFNQTRIDMNSALDGTGNYQLSRMNNASYTGIFYRYDDPSGHSFYTVPKRSSTTTNEVFRVRPDGSVGIGISAPLSKLHIKDNSTSMITIEGDGTGYGNAFTLYKSNNSSNARAMGMFMFDQGGQNEWFAGRPYAGSDAFVINRKGGLSVHSDDVSSLTNGANPNGVTRMFTLNNSGNLGIGTSNPTQRIDLTSNASTLIRIATDSDLEASQNGISFFHKRPNSTVYSSHKIYSDVFNLNMEVDEALSIKNNGILALYSNPAGNIGMGTAIIPTGYKLAVAGNIIADKIKVKKSTNGTWPDFVFRKDYQLPSLSEIEKYVNENSHLPEMPSAAEVEKDGQDLGEMNRLLLKKVEELTLYLIEQEKRIKTLESQVKK